MKIFVVDDSAVYRTGVAQALAREPGLEVVGSAQNGKVALDKLKDLEVDLVIVDMEMPVMDGLQFIKEYRRSGKYIPILTFSNLTRSGAAITMEALLAGANDFLPKSFGTSAEDSLETLREHLVPKITQFRTKNRKDKRPVAPAPAPQRTLSRLHCKFPPRVVAIGSSTGGPEALNHFFKNLPPSFRTPILIAQHMPALYTEQLAAALAKVCSLTVREARDGEEIVEGVVYVAPGDYHMVVEPKEYRGVISLNQEARVNFVRPSVDLLFKSVAKVYKERSLAIMLTGMGEDGLKGCQELKKMGSSVIIQDEESSIVWGMPGAVFRAGFYDLVLPLNEIAQVVGEELREVA